MERRINFNETMGDKKGRRSVSHWLLSTPFTRLKSVPVQNVANQFVAKGGLRDFAEVVAYLRNPLILCHPMRISHRRQFLSFALD